MTLQPDTTSNDTYIMPSRRQESLLLLKIALPLVAAYLAEIAMFNITKIVVGRLGYQELAAVGISGTIVFELLVILMGGLSVVGVLVAGAEGAGDKHEAGNAARQGLIIATIIGIPTTALIWNMGYLLSHIGQDPVVVALATGYLPSLSGVVLPVLWFSVLRSFVTALAKTRAIMIITVVAVGLNYFLTSGLVEGIYGLPRLGISGAGWSITIVNWVMFFILAIYIFRTESLRGYGLIRDRLRLDLRICKEIIRLGVPVCALVMLEAGLFMAVSVISGILGAEVLASYEILNGWLGVPFVIALGFAEGTMVRVAFAMGKNSREAARQAGNLGMIFGVFIIGILVIIPLNYPDMITNIFLDKADPGYETVAGMVRNLFYIVAIFQIFDGMQCIASRALRGIRDTIAPLWFAGLGYWGLGIGGGYILTFPMGFGAQGIWWGLAVGLIVTAVLLQLRFLKLTASK